jgi:hypothetical protein
MASEIQNTTAGRWFHAYYKIYWTIDLFLIRAGLAGRNFNQSTTNDSMIEPLLDVPLNTGVDVPEKLINIRASIWLLSA